MDEDDLLEGEYVNLDEATVEEVEDLPDGGAIVRLSDEDEEEDESDHLANLAETMPEPELARLASQFLDLISKDAQARKKRDEQYEEGLKRTGLGDDAPGGAEFEGASKVVHPMLTEACIDFAARSMKEIFPPGGPAKDNVLDPPTPEKIAKAERKTRLLNWQMTVQSPDVRAELEQLMTQVPLGGSQYLKVGWDHDRNRPTFMFVPVDDMLLPFAATNFYTSQRKTHRQYLTQLDFEQRVKKGMYRDVDMSPAGMTPEPTLSGAANDKIEGREETTYNTDGLRIVFEIDVLIDLDNGDGLAPYLISIDKPSGKVLSIYRNWAEDEERKEPFTWFVEFPFIPWRGVYAIGFPHIIGGLSGAATGALRALLDSAHISNSPSLVKLKGGLNGQSVKTQPGETLELEGGIATDDIRKLVMPMPYNQPSPVLFQLLGFLIDAGRGVVRASLDDIADNNPNAPVGTTLAKLEQGAVVYSAIHARLHDAMARLLRALERLNGLYLDEEMLEKEAGEVIATREDFDGVLDVVPVSDPNIFSEAQRYAQVQAITQRAAALPQLYNARKVEERLLSTLKIPNADELLNPPIEPQEQNAVNENMAASLGRPITAFPEQDHLAHLKTHLAYMMSPAFGMSQMIAPAYLPVMLNHLKEHIAMWYVSETVRVASEALGEDIGEFMRQMNEDEETDTDARQALDKALAEASLTALGAGGQMFSKLPEVVQQAQQMLQQMQQAMMQPQADPRLALEQAKIEQQGKTAAERLQLEREKLQARLQEINMEMQVGAQEFAAKQQTEQQRLALDQQGMLMEKQMHDEDLQADLMKNVQDNETAARITAAKIAAGQEGNLSTGTGINPNPQP
jgi:chaperonin GroES